MQQSKSKGNSPAQQSPVLRLSPNDNVGVAVRAITPGEVIQLEQVEIEAQDPIPFGHKIALAHIARGQKVIKYGAPIGSATSHIAAGQHVHVHNLASDYLPTYAERGAPDDATPGR